jgi:hypothetical protein
LIKTLDEKFSTKLVNKKFVLGIPRQVWLGLVQAKPEIDWLDFWRGSVFGLAWFILLGLVFWLGLVFGLALSLAWFLWIVIK